MEDTYALVPGDRGSLDGLSDASIRDGPWHTRAHSEPQRCLDDVDLEIEP